MLCWPASGTSPHAHAVLQGLAFPVRARREEERHHLGTPGGEGGPSFEGAHVEVAPQDGGPTLLRQGGVVPRSVEGHLARPVKFLGQRAVHVDVDEGHRREAHSWLVEVKVRHLDARFALDVATFVFVSTVCPRRAADFA